MEKSTGEMSTGEELKKRVECKKKLRKRLKTNLIKMF